MVKIAICDDDFFVHEKIAEFVKSLTIKYGKINCESFRDGLEICKFYEKSRLENYFDIIFMDIKMRSINGIKAADFIRKFDKRVLIIFVTNFRQFVMDATYTHLFRFLEKPLKRDEFFEAFEDAYKTLKLRGKVFTYINNYRLTRILAEDIVYFKMHKRQVKICTIQGESEPLWLQLREIHEELKDYGFVRPHQSHLVNLKHVRNIIKNEILLTDGKTLLPISQREAKSVKQAYLEYEINKAGL